MDLTLQRGAFPVELDRSRILFYDMTATWLLIQQYGQKFLTALYRIRGKGKDEFELVSMDALAFFLWVGLQADAQNNDEDLTLDQVKGFLRPWTYTAIFQRVIFAVVGATATPSILGKAPADGEAAKPAAAPAAAKGPGPTKVSTSTKRSGSRSRSSAGRRSASGR